ncbi:O-antigen ligase family protein [Vibrio sp. VB16]|uniref:O-antigen ligase family protein n=1 Tax=Vibrio sp. VB16 TaxID=2785746 RepID=UPI00189E24BD|nr:O-antigen ligase family protein [Vibrio sp. VB16]UGA54977.1 O-antigen ligase family protein [Vibrio sp. VB16]
MNVNKKIDIINIIHYIPLYWVLSGLFLIHKGDKILVGLILLSIILKISLHILRIQKINVNISKFILIILISTIYSSLSYYLNGYSSSEIRVVTSSFLYFLISAPLYSKVNPKTILITIFISTLSILTITLNVFLIEQSGRSGLPLNAIPYANFLSILALTSLYITALTKEIKYKILSYINIIGLLSCVILTDTRGTWLAILISGIILFFMTLKYLTFKSKKSPFVSIILIFCFCGLSYEHILERYEKTIYEIELVQENKLYTSWGIRLQLWRVGYNIIINSPSLVGLGQTEHITIIQDKFKKDEVTKYLAQFDNKNFHNSYIDRTVKYGFIGLGIFLAFLGYPLYRGLKEKDPRLKIPLVTLPIFISVAALTYVPLSHPGTFFLYIFIMHYYIQASDMAREKANKNSVIID